VIIARAGFGDNPDMIKKFTGYEYGKDMFSFRIPGLEGDAFAWPGRRALRGPTMNMEIIYGMPDVMTIGPELHEACRQPHLMVNLLGIFYQ